MNSRAITLINQLALQPHPEGGFFRELHRSAEQVDFHGKKRDALTTIYFLLPENECSRWHLVDADEVWHYYEGAPLDLYLAPADASYITHIRLGTFD
ncbi:MAG: cupin domain-containing protein, partial [Bacteroidia bacterium]